MESSEKTITSVGGKAFSVPAGRAVSAKDSMIDLALGERVRELFPFFSADGGGRAYLDTAASAQKPRVVIDRVRRYYEQEHANIHRGAYRLSAEATQAYDQAREGVSQFLNAPTEREIVFTRGATEAINLVSYALEPMFQAGDSILCTTLEHHSNIVPWQMLAERRELSVHFVGMTPSAQLDLEDLERKLQEHRPKLLAVTAHSNAFGTLVPVKEIVALAHSVGAKVLLDATQLVVHGPVDVQDLGVDFLVFSGHKIYGPTGIGVLYAKLELLEEMRPFHGGGDMIEVVSVEGSSFAPPPQKFEAGTPPIAQAIGLAEALSFLSSLGREVIEDYERAIFEYGFELLSREEGVTLFGPATEGSEGIDHQRAILPFTVDIVHPHDLATIADDFDVQIRAGHHCAMPALKSLGIQSTARASVGIYTVKNDFDLLCEAIRRGRKLFS